jgi:hypothetical protein
MFTMWQWDQAIDQGRRHDVVAEDLAPVLEALVRGQYRRGVIVPTGHELEESTTPVRLIVSVQLARGDFGLRGVYRVAHDPFTCWEWPA